MSVDVNDAFNEILTKDGNVFFVDRLWIKSLAEGQWAKILDLHRSLELASDEGADSFFRVDVKQLTGEQLIQYFLGKSNTPSSVDISDYRVLTDAFSQLKPGVVVLYKTHLISSDVLRLVSKLINHVKEHNLEWKFVLYGKAKKLTQISKDRLFIDHYYPEEYKNTLQISKKVTNDNVQPDVSDKGFDFIKGLFLVFVLAIVGVLVYLAVERPYSTLDNQPIVNEVVEPELNKVNESSQWQDNLQPNQTLEEMIRESKLQELEFEERMAEINASLQLEEARLNESANQSKPVSNQDKKESTNQDIKASSPVKTIRLLSSEVEQAVLDGDLEFLKSFSDKSMLNYGQSSKGETPLIISVNNGHTQIVSWLLQQNVPVDSRDSYGRTALFYSAVQGNEGFIRQLMQAGAQVSLGSRLSKTPLMAAVHNNHYESARLLLATRKAKVNIQDHSGWSALFYAVWNSNSKMASLLLEFGADISLVDNRGLNINQVAEAAGFAEWQNIVNRNQ